MWCTCAYKLISLASTDTLCLLALTAAAQVLSCCVVCVQGCTGSRQQLLHLPQLSGCVAESGQC